MEPKTRCKFRLDAVTRTAHNGATLKFSAVTSGSDENKSFWKWTPSGELTFSTVNETIADRLKLGAEYYLDITEAQS